MKTVADILQSKARPNNNVESDTKVFDALVMMNSVNLSYLVVMEKGHFKGIFSERDYTRNVILKDRTSKTTEVHEVMSVNLPLVSTDDSVEKCMNLLDVHKTRYLPVFDGGNFCGVVTLNDVLRLAIREKADVFDEVAARLADQADKIR